MPNYLLNYDMIHIIGIITSLFTLIFSGILIKKYTKKYENIEIFWIPWLLIITFVFGNKFI